MTAPRVATNPEVTPIAETLEPPALAALSTTSQVLIIAMCWIGVGLATAVLLRRRAHEFPPNAALGIVLGPLFLFLAYDMIRRRESEKPITLSPPSGTGPAVMVVAVGDLEEPEAVLDAVGELATTGPIMAAVPVEYEIAHRVHSLGAPPPPSEQLTELARTLARFDPGLMMLPGQVEKSIPLAMKATGADVVLLVGSESDSAALALGQDLESRVLRVGA
jgi:hypothetical protein